MPRVDKRSHRSQGNMKITVEANIDAPIDAVWRAYNDPDGIVQWDASNDWHTTKASNDLRVGGLLELRIEAKDGGTGLDFAATYTRLEPKRLIEWRMDEDRYVRVEFIEMGTAVTVRVTFDAECTISVDEQQLEWQGVLDSFARHVAALKSNW